jgi:hypothetical protein
MLRVAPLVASCLLIAFAAEVRAAHPQVSFARHDDRIEVHVDGRPLATYVFGDPKILRPFLADVRTPGGVQVTRNYPPVDGVDTTDHDTMHPGIWLAFGDLSGVDFWRNQGRVEHAGFIKRPQSSDNSGEFTVRNRYLYGERLVCNEDCRLSFWALPHEVIIVWDSTFFSPTEFFFGDQEEMGLGVRVATPLIVMNGGELTNSENRHGEKEIWGRLADWCDYSGTIDGQRVGVLVVPDPVNFRRSWFHARDYGLLVANPFGLKAFTRSADPSKVVVPPGETFRLRFAIVVHWGDVDLTAAASSATTELNAERNCHADASRFARIGLVSHETLEKFQPVGRNRTRDRARLAALLGGLPPVEADPAGDFPLAIDKLLKLGTAAFKREGFFDHDWLADMKSLECCGSLVEFARLRVNVNGNKVELGGHLFRNEARGESGAVQTPIDQSHRDQVFSIAPADGLGECGNPVARHISPIASGQVERDELHEMFAGERRAEPIVATPRARYNWLIHQVVAEDRIARGARGRNHFPESGLRGPTLRFVERVIPGGNIGLVITTQSGEVQVQ